MARPNKNRKPGMILAGLACLKRPRPSVRLIIRRFQETENDKGSCRHSRHADPFSYWQGWQADHSRWSNRRLVFFVSTQAVLEHDGRAIVQRDGINVSAAGREIPSRNVENPLLAVPRLGWSEQQGRSSSVADREVKLGFVCSLCSLVRTQAFREKELMAEACGSRNVEHT